LRRRHMNESQRAMVAAKLATLKLGDNQHSEGLPIGRGSELLNVGERSVARAREVQARGAPELIRAVELGKIAVSAALDIASLPIEQQREIIATANPRTVLELVRERRAERAKVRNAERIQKLIDISNQNAPLPRDRRYSIILADAPWRYEHHPPGGETRAFENHYPTMTVEE